MRSSTVTRPLASSMAARAGPTPLTYVRGVARSMRGANTVYNALVKFTLVMLAAAAAFAADIRVGIIGTDTSHVPAFTKMLNDASAPDHIPGARVVAAFKGGTKEI